MCDCVSTINEKLLEGGYNTRIKTPLTLNPDLSNAGQKLEIVTVKADPKVRVKPVAMFSSFCPFCGEKHSVERETDMEYEVRVAGPDDVIIFSDELEAHQRANDINKQYLEDCAANPGQEVLCVATVHEIND